MNEDLRLKLVDASRELVRLGLNQGTAGNISARVPDGFLITPTGIKAEQMQADEIASMGWETGAFEGPVKPSSEWRLHRDILHSRPDVGAVVHTHSLYATVLSTLRRSIPALHYMIAIFNGPEIRCTPYAPFGTQALSDLILEYLGERHGVLLGNHGMVATGRTVDQAMWRANELETLAKMSYLAHCAGNPVILPDDEIAEITGRFREYGLSAEPPGES
jgi:L-fuculose-phosphate aldolase